MAKKYKVTQELANSFPDWSKIRTDEQSVGQGLLNVIGRNLETIETELFRGFSNTSLTTVNTQEIDLVYRFQLPETFEFSVDNATQLQPLSLAPTVSGLVGNTWYLVDEAETGTIKEFWYDAIPDRLNLLTTYSGTDHVLLDSNSEEYTFSGINNPFLSNTLYVEVSGVSLLEERPDLQDGFLQAKIRISGTTWKDTEEAEEIPFIYNDKKRTLKGWKEIDQVQALDFPASGEVRIWSHGFNQVDYKDSFGDISQFKHSRDNLSTFWKIGTSCWQSDVVLLECETYAASHAIDVLRNRTDREAYREWELLDSGNNVITPLDIAPIPFMQRAWVVTESGLLLYDLEFDQPSQSELVGKTNSPLVQIVTQRDYITRDEEVEVDLRFVRPVRTVIKHRLTVKFPDGVSMGVLEDGTLVSTSTDYWVNNIIETRSLRSPTDFTLTELGDHIFTLEVVFNGNLTEIDKRIVRVSSKTALAEFNLFNIIGTTVAGVDIDHQQHILVRDVDSGVHHLEPHYDTMLIDYDTKEIIFHENYSEVKIIK